MAVVYPFKKYNYKVTVGSLGDMGFSEISKGDISYEPIEYREGNYESSSPIKQQGIVKYGNVTLKYGLTASKALYDWLNSAQTATVKQENVKIELLGDDHKSVLTSWTLQKAIPIKLALSDFSATGNELAVESVDIACEAIIRG